MRMINPADVRFEPMAEKYLPQVLEIYDYYIRNTTVTFHINPLSLEEMRALVFHKNPRHGTFVLLHGDEVVGYVILSAHHPREAYDRTGDIAVYIKKDCRGARLGEAAVRHIEAFAARQGFGALIAVVCGENERSIRLFRRLGYFQCAHYKRVGEKFGRVLDVLSFEKLLEDEAVEV